MPKFSVRKPLTVFVSVLAILVLGVVAYVRMTPDLMPNMNFPYVVIVTSDPGASPEAVETDITRPMEQSMATLNQIKAVSSTSENSVSVVMMEFEDNVNMDSLSVDIQQKINVLQGQWDDSVGTPMVLKMNPSMMPVEVVAIGYQGKDIHELSTFVEDTLQDKLAGITGVAQVNVQGLEKSQLHVVLDQKKMDRLSKKLSRAIEAQMDSAVGQISAARDEIHGAQGAIRDAQQNAIRETTSQALATVQETLATLRHTRDQLEQNLQELLEIQSQKAALDAKSAKFDLQIERVRGDETLTDAQKDAAIEEIRQDPEYIQLQSDRALLDLRLAALHTSWEELDTTIQSWREDLADLESQIQQLEQNDYAELADKVTDGLMTMGDAVSTILSTHVQLDLALSQLDDTLHSVEGMRQEALRKADLAGALNIQTITAMLTAQNFSMPAGYIEEDGVNYMVSVGDTIKTQDALEDMVLFDLGIKGVQPIRLKDVAQVFRTDNSDEIYAKLNGDHGVMVTFTKQSTYATAEVSDNINAALEKLEAKYDGLTFASLMDQGEYIYMIINSIFSSLGWGILFSILILYLFLRDLRPTIITLCAIPVSLIFAVVLMYFSHVTINMISLSGLAVAVGMLVDNSVVVIENIYRLRSKGATVIQAAVSGAQQVLGAITSSTLTTVCVFLPIVFLDGLTRQLFTDLALIMTYALLASLVVALTLVPAMAAGMLRKEKKARFGMLDRIYPYYRKAVGWSLGHKIVVLGLALVLLVGSAGLTLARGFSYMPTMDMNNISIRITMPEDADMAASADLADEVVRRIGTLDNITAVGAAMLHSQDGGMSMPGSEGGPYDVTAYVTLPKGASGLEAGAKIEELCADMPCEIKSAGSMEGTSSMMSSGISVHVFGEDMVSLHTAAQELSAAMAKVPGTEEVSDGLEDAVDALHVAIDRNKAMRKGMTVAQIYMQVASALKNTESSAELTLDGVDMGVSVESSEDARLTRENLLDLEIRVEAPPASSGTPGGMDSTSMGSAPDRMGGSGKSQTFPLSDVATVEKTVSLNSIQHMDQRRHVTLSAGIAAGYNVTHVSADVRNALEQVNLPDGITLSFQGENEEIMESMRQLALMLLLGVLLVYCVMVAQFQSLKSPFIVMFTIPLAFTGGFLALLVSGEEFSVISLVGFVMLVGIIVNNGIVLVDYINQLRLAGMDRQEAIIEAGVTRMRPILMTSLTTILGLVVMAFGRGVGTAMMRPVALVSIGGLLYATLMTLLVVPCMYDIVARRDLRHVAEEELETIYD